MAAPEGSCARTITRRGNIVECAWKLICGDNGWAIGDTGEYEWTYPNVYGELVGVEIEWESAAANYDVYVKDENGIDLLHGLGVNLSASASHARNRFCPVDNSQDIGTVTNAEGKLIRLFNETLTVTGLQFGAQGSDTTTVKIYIRLFPYHGMRG